MQVAIVPKTCVTISTNRMADLIIISISISITILNLSKASFISNAKQSPSSSSPSPSNSNLKKSTSEDRQKFVSKTSTSSRVMELIVRASKRRFLLSIIT